MACSYRPGGWSDDEISSDEFDFNDGVEIRRPVLKNLRSEVYETDEAFRRAIVEGNLSELKNLLSQVKIQFNINEPIVHNGYTVLMHACHEAQPEIVEYLIKVQEAEVNTDSDSYSPLMIACRSDKNSEQVAKVVKLLLDAGAVINTSSKYGDTPLIFACQFKHTKVVSMLINDASLDATNNSTGNSAIFYAVESNSPEIVALLLKKGAQYNVANRKGYTPRNVAEIFGFQEIVSLFPAVESDQYAIPVEYTNFSHFKDLVPGILGDASSPPYFQRLGHILAGLELSVLHEVFAKAEVGLPQFLTMTEEDLSAVGVKLPILQQRLLSGLFRFHGHEWNKKSIPSCKKKIIVDTYLLYMMFAGQLEHLVVMKSGIKFIIDLIERKKLPKIRPKYAILIAKSIMEYQEYLDEMFRFNDKVSRCSHKELVDEINAKKVNEPQEDKMLLRKLLACSSITVGLISFMAAVLFVKSRR